MLISFACRISPRCKTIERFVGLAGLSIPSRILSHPPPAWSVHILSPSALGPGCEPRDTLAFGKEEKLPCLKVSSFCHIRTIFFFILGLFSSSLKVLEKTARASRTWPNIWNGGGGTTSNIRESHNSLKWWQVTYLLRGFYFSFSPSPHLFNLLVIYQLHQLSSRQ